VDDMIEESLGYIVIAAIIVAVVGCAVVVAVL
jgi:hypothetical protein